MKENSLGLRRTGEPPPRPLTEDEHASTLPTGAVITVPVAAAIILTILLLFMFRGCATEPEPTTAPMIYPQKPIVQQIIPALPVVEKPVYKYNPSPNVPCEIPGRCGAKLFVNGKRVDPGNYLK
ncbi:MAG: hypothetical protein ABSB40_12725 [Nitrososphaeria archaeon]|jgi:hypothetical protein